MGGTLTLFANIFISDYFILHRIYTFENVYGNQF